MAGGYAFGLFKYSMEMALGGVAEIFRYFCKGFGGNIHEPFGFFDFYAGGLENS